MARFGLAVAPTARGYLVAAAQGGRIVARAVDRRGVPRGPVRVVPVRAEPESIVRVRMAAPVRDDGRVAVPARVVSGAPSRDRHATGGLFAARAKTLLWAEGSRIVGVPWAG